MHHSNVVGSPDFVTFRGIAKTRSLGDLQVSVNSQPVKIKKLKRPAILCFETLGNDINPLMMKTKMQFIRELLLNAVNKISLLKYWAWRSFELKIPLDAFQDGMSFMVIDHGKCVVKEVYVSREVARFCVPTKKIDHTLEYEQKRFWNNYKILFSQAMVTFSESDIRLPEDLNNCLPERVQQELTKLTNTYFYEMIKGDLGISVSPKENFESKTYSGSIHRSEGSVDPNKNSDLWRLNSVKKAVVLHGNVIYGNLEFHVHDRSKLAGYGGSFNRWPSLLYQDKGGTYYTPKEKEVVAKLESAFFVGGTKNWMHFVIEDLPRIIKLNTLPISRDIPLLVSSNLGEQIRESIEVLSNRSVIAIDAFQKVEVDCLYYMDFQNPLQQVMQGDFQSAALLFDPKVLNLAKQIFRSTSDAQIDGPTRVLIRREKGLFRPLVNGDKISRILEKRYGFTSVFAGELTLREAIHNFSNAEIIVGEYGAGLANCIFMRDESLVIEIRGELERVSIEYQELIKSLGHKHKLLLGKNRLISRMGISRGPYVISKRDLIDEINLALK
jgi:capsular polysaccharide biosynthesis protein